MRALISVSDKTGVVDFARELVSLGWEILSTSGTMKMLKEAGLPVTSVSDVTGFPEICDGRVKTLHPKIHGALLARRDIPDHLKQLEDNGIEKIDLVCVNLYPFRETIAKPDVTMEGCRGAHRHRRTVNASQRRQELGLGHSGSQP